MKIISLVAQNFQGLKAFEMEPDGKSVVIRGRNGSGKSSAANALFLALAGTAGKKADLAEPIHHGAEFAEVTVDLGEFKVIRKWTASGPSVSIRHADGTRAGKPAALLASLLSDYSLDPVAFLKRRPQDQISDILALTGIAPPVEAVEKITGESWPAHTGEFADEYLLRLSADTSVKGPTGEIYAQRRDARHRLAEAEAALAIQRRELAEIGELPQNDGRSISDLVSELGLLASQQDVRQRSIRDIEKMQQSLSSGKAILDSRMAAIKAMESRVENLRAEIECMETEIDSKQNALLDEHDALAALRRNIADGMESVEKMPDLNDKIEATREALKRADANSERINERRFLVDGVEKIEAQVEKLRADSNRLHGHLQAIRDLKKNMLNGIDMGAPCLEIGDGELRLNGVPFSKCSSSEQLRVACAIAMKKQPQVRLLRVDNGEQLDAEHQRELLAIAAENDFQVLLTSVAEGDLSVEIIDGEHPSEGTTK